MSSSNKISISPNFSKRTFHQTAFTWTIDHFSTKWSDSRKCSNVFNYGKRGHCQLYLYPNFGGYLSLTLYPQLGVSTHANFKVSLIDSKGKKRLLYDNFRVVHDNSKIEFSKLISGTELFKPSNGYLPDDTLTLHVEIGFLDKAENPPKVVPGPKKVETTPKLLEDFGNLLKSGTLADVKLLVVGKTFSAHKSILSARSPVFAALFAHDPKEKQDSQVEILDVNLVAFEAFIEFLYTGAMPTLGDVKSAKELLLVADKYTVEQLKSICEDYLVTQLTIGTAPDLLVLANSLNTDKLKESAVEFMRSLLKNGNLSDVKLLVGGKTISAHKSILIARSPVFAAMFAHDSKKKLAVQVAFHEENVEAFEALLDFLYTGTKPTLESISSAKELLITADKYEAGQLKTVCEDYLISQMTIESAPNLLLFANSQNSPKLKKNSIEFVRGRGNELLDAVLNDPKQMISMFQYLAEKNEANAMEETGDSEKGKKRKQTED